MSHHSTYKPIEQGTTGDRVLSRDEATQQVVAQTVVQTFTREVDAILLLRFDNGQEVETTPGHPFFVEGKGWTLAGQLALGNAIVTRAGPAARLTSVQNKGERTRVFNFAVEGTHSYFVGTHDGGLWVHNNSWKFNPAVDVDLRGSGHGANYAIDMAFLRTGLPRSEFEVTRWGTDIYGKTHPVEWRHATGAEVNIDWPHTTEGPPIPHVGYQTGGKRGSGGAVRGHILLDSVPRGR